MIREWGKYGVVGDGEEREGVKGLGPIVEGVVAPRVVEQRTQVPLAGLAVGGKHTRRSNC
jgi:allophanate hydrolase subunit 1